MRRTCSLEFRDQIRRTYPGLGEHESYWRLMRRLLFSTKRDRQSNRVIIDWQALAKDEGKVANSNYKARRFLQRFQRDVMPDLRWEEYRFDQVRRARTAITPWPDAVLRAMEREHGVLGGDGERVYFIDGRRYTRRSRSAARIEDQQAATELASGVEHPARPLLEYLNALPPHRFTGLLDQLPAALEAANAIAKASTREHQLQILASVRDQPQQFYQFSKKGKTVRIFPANAGLLMLKKSVRRALCRGWHEFDLRSAHLAICARLWRLPKVERFLRDGENIWQSLADHYEVSLGEAFKAAVKECLYSLMFGASKEGLTWELNGSIDVADEDARISTFWAPPAGARLFFEHPIIGQLWTGRNRRIREIKKAGSITTAFGDQLECDGSRESATSLMAQEAQAMELWLLLPVLDAARGTGDFDLVLWQHDGFSVAFRDGQRAARWTARIQQIVSQRAREAEIFTGLDGEVL